MQVVEVGLAPSLADRQVALQALLGTDYQVAEGTDAPTGVVVFDEASSAHIRAVRASGEDLGIIVLLDRVDGGDGCNPRSIVRFVEAGADVCLVAPETSGLAAHIRALAAHHPDRVQTPRACLA